MDHLSTMKRKNVVLVYDLLLEMLDANTSNGSQTSSSSPSSDTYSDQYQYTQAPPSRDLTNNDYSAPPSGPADALTLDSQLQVPDCHASPPSHSLVAVHMTGESTE